jgi:hypothetical protein
VKRQDVDDRRRASTLGEELAARFLEEHNRQVGHPFDWRRIRTILEIQSDAHLDFVRSIRVASGQRLVSKATVRDIEREVNRRRDQRLLELSPGSDLRSIKSSSARTVATFAHGLLAFAEDQRDDLIVLQWAGAVRRLLAGEIRLLEEPWTETRGKPTKRQLRIDAAVVLAVVLGIARGR